MMWQKIFYGVGVSHAKKYYNKTGMSYLPYFIDIPVISIYIYVYILYIYIYIYMNSLNNQYESFIEKRPNVELH